VFLPLKLYNNATEFTLISELVGLTLWRSGIGVSGSTNEGL